MPGVALLSSLIALQLLQTALEAAKTFEEEPSGQVLGVAVLIASLRGQALREVGLSLSMTLWHRFLRHSALIGR